jgi:shikimate dehydrogenase
MHNTAFKAMSLNARYVPILVKDLDGAIRMIRGRNIKGVSVTMPLKTTIMPHLDKVDAAAQIIGAVNTITNEKGELSGHNTDWTGIVCSIQEHLEIQGKTVAILGAGGAARAAAYAILRSGGTPVIFNRTLKKGEHAAMSLGCSFYPINQLSAVKADLLINTTPVGMDPHREETPVRKEDLVRFRWVMDIVYNPLKTRLGYETESVGCGFINGLGMFVHQGAEQIRIWTGLEPPVDLMAQVVEQELTEKCRSTQFGDTQQ